MTDGVRCRRRAPPARQNASASAEATPTPKALRVFNPPSRGGLKKGQAQFPASGRGHSAAWAVRTDSRGGQTLPSREGQNRAAVLGRGCLRTTTRAPPVRQNASALAEATPAPKALRTFDPPSGGGLKQERAQFPASGRGHSAAWAAHADSRGAQTLPSREGQNRAAVLGRGCLRTTTRSTGKAERFGSRRSYPRPESAAHFQPALRGRVKEGKPRPKHQGAESLTAFH
ncbi:hypothetical protein QO014_004709 [Kaistia dalseonensis]|uniref:Uncharacterized protein n=1 Tax=Kaistia dalseonensis TaxID=410840 RepID=A0ABU0HD99_9HYPH|nr:hypothetical protein [Kaistia dalseonensis]